MAYCRTCDRYFPHHVALRQHKQNSSAHSGWICLSCDKEFSSDLALKQHYVQSPRHAYCQYCDEHFDDDEDLMDHAEEDHFACRSCVKLFEHEYRYKSHMRENHWWCEPCNRTFQTESNLESHKNSSIHQPRNFKCPGARCNRQFVSQSALTLHWEAGTCPSGITRNILNREVARIDRNNVITNPSRLIRGLEEPTVTDMWATKLAWNAETQSFECYLCHRQFGKLQSLNAHLQSPRHMEKIYRCPNTTGCGSEFSTLSALCQHVERDRCGVQRFKPVKDMMTSLSRRWRSITL